MQLTKHHGLGNDFLVVLSDSVPDGAPDLARRLCNRTTGIGADGLIFGTPSAAADLVMTLYNSNGSAAEISGNGIRCLAQAEARHRGVEEVDLAVETGGGLRAVELRPGPDPSSVEVCVDMGPVGPGPAIPDDLDVADLPVIAAATAEVGNPHLVLHLRDGAHADPVRYGPALEAQFDGVNVHFMSVAAEGLALVHWERGAGVTMACGSGAVAGAAAARQWGLAGDQVPVHMPGGTALVRLNDTATLTGPAVYVAAIEVSDG